MYNKYNISLILHDWSLIEHFYKLENFATQQINTLEILLYDIYIRLDYIVKFLR